MTFSLQLLLPLLLAVGAGASLALFIAMQMHAAARAAAHAEAALPDRRRKQTLYALVLALPDRFALAPLVVVTQTLVELVVMVLFVRLIPRLIPDREDA